MPYVERELLLKDGPPWGFRLQDTASQGLVISRIRRRSPAASAGVKEGDVVLEINKLSTNGMSHLRAVQVLESTFYILTIRVGRQEARVELPPPPPPPQPEPVAPEPMPVASSMQLNFSWQQSRPLPPPTPEPQPEPPPPPPPPKQLTPPPPAAPDIVIPASPGVKPVPISKLIKEYDVPALPKSDRKQYADSAFYEDPDKYYPSVAEQKQMAKRVADSLTAVFNKNSRGAKMFERRRNKWATREEEEEEEEVAVAAVAPNLAQNAVPAAPLPGPQPFVPTAPPPPPSGLGFGPPAPALGFVPPPPPPPPPLGLLAAATKPRPTQEQDFHSRVFEQAKMLPKSTHDKIAPQQCFDIAAALHSSSSRGSQLFAKRRAKAKKWEVEGPEPQPEARPLPVQSAAPLWANNPASFVSPPGPPGRSSNGTPGRQGLDSNSNLSSSSSVSGHSMVIHSTPEFGSPSPSWSNWRPQAAQMAASSPYDIASPRSADLPRDSGPGFFGSLPRGGGSGNGAAAAGSGGTKPSEWRPVQFKIPPKVA